MSGETSKVSQLCEMECYERCEFRDVAALYPDYKTVSRTVPRVECLHRSCLDGEHCRWTYDSTRESFDVLIQDDLNWVRNLGTLTAD